MNIARLIRRLIVAPNFMIHSRWGWPRREATQGKSQDAHLGSGLIPLFRRRLFEILKFISTLISACRRMSSCLSQAALRFCASCAAFGDWLRRLSISHWSLPLFYRGWITVMRHWLAFRPACLTVSSLSSTRLPGLLLDFIEP